MTFRISFFIIMALLITGVSCDSQKKAKEEIDLSKVNLDITKKKVPHRYGGWYCPDNFGFVPVDIQHLDEVPAIADRLPTEQELQENKSLIKVDTEKHPDARALEMDLPRVGQIYSQYKGMNELIIVIQAIIVNEDTIVGYRFPNGGNGSAWMSEVTFLSDEEVAAYGPQPFYYSNSTLNASTEEIWEVLTQTDYFKLLGEKFNQKEIFSSEWTTHSETNLVLKSEDEVATGHVGILFGNLYLHIDYDRNGFHYSEKLLIMENQEDSTTELFFASGPFPKDFDQQKVKWDNWMMEVKGEL